MFVTVASSLLESCGQTAVSSEKASPISTFAIIIKSWDEIEGGFEISLDKSPRINGTEPREE